MLLRRIAMMVMIVSSGACRDRYTTITPEYQPLTEAVYASGTLRPDNEYQVFAPVGGILQARRVREGEAVDSGQVLFVIERQAQDLQLASATRRLATARRNVSSRSSILAELQLSLDNAHEQFVNDSIHYQRYHRLRAQNVGTASAYDQARLRYLAARNNHLAAQRALTQRADALQDELTEARIAYQLAAQAQHDAQVTSRTRGIVYSLGPEVGEMVNLNQPLARVGSQERLVLRLAVDERDIARVSEGQTVLFTTDLLPDTVLNAQVSRIHPFLNQADRSFTVEARVVPTKLPLYPGSTVEANIIIRQKDRALVIPKTVLLGQDSVWVVRDGERQRVRITTGVDNMEAVEVVAGLDEATEVIVP